MVHSSIKSCFKCPLSHARRHRRKGERRTDLSTRTSLAREKLDQQVVTSRAEEHFFAFVSCASPLWYVKWASTVARRAVADLTCGILLEHSWLSAVVLRHGELHGGNVGALERCFRRTAADGCRCGSRSIGGVGGLRMDLAPSGVVLCGAYCTLDASNSGCIPSFTGHVSRIGRRV